ncbi:assimilatory sulfite reductase (NADPH) flavoprotein subunit [Thalassotalea sp. Y01]|uniref:assimilatory sulfite reductase (NADPH) flavoprotein subunit n=1 Tax=Thalassotalea sp. Y01 TaxID=2729613 RepID=UPI00145F7983|nr:assimilatory sulfite reductase (NADPH) flavoprotein subunit [Thalassotalea sp. Y01]NMP17248.1 assimilatory sulfite reductase (NADPH) flavoprotein subunit [Thalassotalea sp. Y01]
MLVKANNAANESGASLSSAQLEQLQQVIGQYTPLQLAWASGYLAAKSETSPQAEPSAQLNPAPVLTILYGSQTGNAKGVAEQVKAAAEQSGLAVNLYNMADYKVKNLKTESHVIIVASTNGEGEPPDDAMALHEFLASKRAPKLNDLQYAVLALGDSSYEYFCQTGKDFDQRLAALGGKPLFERVDCDVDYQPDADTWRDKVVDKLAEQFKAEQQNSNTGADVVTLPFAQSPAASVYNKQNPFTASIIENQKITGRDSNKVVHHIEIDLQGSDLQYQPGDALGVWPVNDNALVDSLIAQLGLNADSKVTLAEQQVTLQHALLRKKEMTALNKAVLQKWADLADNADLNSLLADGEQCRQYLSSTQLIDMSRQFPVNIDAQGLVDLLASLAPRLYSIASSQQEVEDEVHLTVGLLDYQQDEQQRRVGAASGFLIERLQADDEIDVFIEHNNNFRLPENDDTAVIMIGPGTGIAPFRAFLQERDARQAGGDNWLFFGDQTFTQDFLYQTEWQAYLKSSLLSKLDVAFSRDQQQKVYVQHKLQKQAEQVYQWLQQGAHLYICGDMQRMAKDVHNTLVEIVSEKGQMSLEDAEQYLKQLRIDKRYQKDVY